MKAQVIPMLKYSMVFWRNIQFLSQQTQYYIFIYFLVFHLAMDKDYDICMTKDCVTAASRIIQDMDASIDPCDDFYAFSCGGFIDNTNVPADKAQVGTMSQMRVNNFDSFIDSLNL